MKISGSHHIFLVLYVDDILLASSDLSLLNETKNFLSSNFDMKDLGEASLVLEIEIHRDRNRKVLGLSQEAYINRVLKRFNMDLCKAGSVPILKGDKFTKQQCPKNNLKKRSNEEYPICKCSREFDVCLGLH